MLHDGWRDGGHARAGADDFQASGITAGDDKDGALSGCLTTMAGSAAAMIGSDHYQPIVTVQAFGGPILQFGIRNLVVSVERSQIRTSQFLPHNNR